MAIPGDAVYRGKITVQNAKVSGSSDHSNFPVLLTEDNFWAELMDAGSESATNGGGGLRFSSDEAGTTQIAHEVVSFVTSATEGSRAAEVWVKAPTLAYSTDTDIHVWSSPTASEEASTSTYGSEAVWADYEAVLHLDDASTIVDSTGNRTPTLSGTLTSVDGPWGDAIQFSGSQYITLADDAGLDSLTGPGQNRAISMLVNFTTTSNLVIAEKGTNKHFVTQTFGDAHAGKIGFRTNTASADTAYGPQINNGAWRLFRGGQDNVNNYAVADTVKVTKAATASAPADDGDDFVIGSRLGSYGYNGKIKELRLRNQWPSDDWDATEYNNLLDPATFAIAGTFQTGGGGTAVTKDAAIIWNALNEAQSDSAIKWNSLNSISADKTTRWDALNAVEKDATLICNILNSAEIDSTIRWDALNAITQDATLLFNALNSVELDSSIKWDALNEISQDTTLIWNVESSLQTVTKDATVRWDAFGYVQRDFTTIWNALNTVQRDSTILWDALNAIEIDADLKWDVLNSIAKDISVLWDIEGLTAVTKDLSLKWSVLNETEADLTLRWQVEGEGLTPDFHGNITINSLTKKITISSI